MTDKKEYCLLKKFNENIILKFYFLNSSAKTRHMQIIDYNFVFMRVLNYFYQTGSVEMK